MSSRFPLAPDSLPEVEKYRFQNLRKSRADAERNKVDGLDRTVVGREKRCINGHFHLIGESTYDQKRTGMWAEGDGPRQIERTELLLQRLDAGARARRDAPLGRGQKVPAHLDRGGAAPAQRVLDDQQIEVAQQGD